jgi:hypothetical protein
VEDRFAYLMVVMLMDRAPEVEPGLFRSPSAGAVVDLRRAVPSFYLRPHPQHGLLVHPYGDDGLRPPLSREPPRSRSRRHKRRSEQSARRHYPLGPMPRESHASRV